MQDHFDGIGPSGRRMMRQTAALQVCLDLGEPGTAAERWLLANLAGPALSAAFANSPVLENQATGTPGTRSLIWQGVDASRTGFAGAQVGRDASTTVERYLDFALDAVFIPLGGNGAVGGGMSARVPLADLLGRDDVHLQAADLGHHLSTLFPPVRPRGHLEIRYLDALPSRWMPVAVGVLATLMYEPRTTQEALEALHDADIGAGAWRRSSTVAMQDAELRSTAVALFDIARRGATRLGTGYLPADMVARMCEYHERFPQAGRTPADDQLESFVNHPEVLATWR
jgi:glutamate--cysteine ligase